MIPSAENIAQANTDAINEREKQARALVLGGKIRPENGFGVAVEIAERYFSEK